MNIVLGISSGIAAYKITDLTKNLVKKSHKVDVVMTEKSRHLVSPEEMETITGNPVFIDLFDASFSKEKILKERKVDHIELARQADIVVIAPATANTIANLASGKADDFLSTTVLATRAPVLVCPSMNDQMWLHQAVQENITTLHSYGYIVMTPDSGSLACGTEGVGRLPAIEAIEKEIEYILETKNSLQGKKIMVTAGGTSEPIDSARILSNRSSGKMGIAIAEECTRRGAEVLLLRSNSAIGTNASLKQKIFVTENDLSNQIQEYIKEYDVLIHAAAVSDFTVEPFEGKLDSDKPATLQLIPTTKIINDIKHWNPNILLVGFKAIHGSIDKHKEKIEKVLQDSQADYLVVNDISRDDIGFESDQNEVTIVDRKLAYTKIAKTHKKDLAKDIITKLSEDARFAAT